MNKSLYVRARLSLASLSRDVADLARGLVGDVSTPMISGERIRAARRLRLMSLNLVDLAVLSELSEGATWDDIAGALGIPLEEAQRRYAATWVQWQNGTSEYNDEIHDDLAGTATALDQWWARHAEPWEAADRVGPVSQVLVDGETAPRDR